MSEQSSNMKALKFIDLVPLPSVLDEYVKTTKQFKRLLVAGIRRTVGFCAVNQSDKAVRMIRWGYEELDTPQGERRFYEEERTLSFFRGELLEVKTMWQFDRLFKGVLNEIDLFVDIDNLEELIEYQKDDRLYREYVPDRHLTPPNEFKAVDLKHVFIRRQDVEGLAEVVAEHVPSRVSKQAQREEVFINWLQDKSLEEVRWRKKDDVWAELFKIDRRLFSVGSKAFFRNQKVIKFKSGRKSSVEK